MGFVDNSIQKQQMTENRISRIHVPFGISEMALIVWHRLHWIFLKIQREAEFKRIVILRLSGLIKTLKI